MNHSLTLLALLAPASPADGAAPARPNVVIIHADDLGVNDLGCYGRKDHHTPHLDRLAKEGTRFGCAYCSQPICSPSRAGLMTGRWPARLHLTTYLPGRPDAPSQKLLHPKMRMQLPLEETTLAEALHKAGYATACVGKWHLGGPPDYLPMKRGFDEFYGTVANTPFFLPRNFVDSRVSDEIRPVKDETFYTTDAYAARAVDWIGKQKGKPFFLYLPFNAQHNPLEAPKKYLDLYGDPGYEGKEVGVTPYGFARNLTPELLRRLHAAYAGEVTMMDHWLGHFMERFYELGLQKNTAIVLLSDHGFLLGERVYTCKVPSQLHPELAQVPFVVVLPDDRGAGTVSQYFASTHDVGPTVLSMVGIEPPSWMNGTNLAVALEGREPAQRRDFHYGGMYNRFYIRTDDWVLIGDNQGNERTLCDLRNDPHEFDNVVTGNPKVSKELYDTILEAAGGPLPYYT